jgi:hypothetical protein
MNKETQILCNDLLAELKPNIFIKKVFLDEATDFLKQKGLHYINKHAGTPKTKYVCIYRPEVPGEQNGFYTRPCECDLPSYRINSVMLSKYLKQIAELTKYDNPIEARILISRHLLKNSRLLDMYEVILNHINKYAGLHYQVAKHSYRVDQYLKEQVYKMYGKTDGQRIIDCL